MNIHYYILTYNRPKILSHCLSTAFSNTTVKPNAVFIFDDGSVPEVKRALLEFSIENSKSEMPIHIEFHGVNMGVGWNFENLYRKIEQHSPDIAVIIESDYIWRKGWLEDCLAVFEASPWTVMIPGTSHPDFRDTDNTKRKLPTYMSNQFGFDLESRPVLYTPFNLETTRGPILVQGVSNSCGCLVLNWRRLQKILHEGDAQLQTFTTKDYNTRSYWNWMSKAFHKNQDRHSASDAFMSGTLSMFAERYMKDLGIDIFKNFGSLDICDFSISNHMCAGGLNGMVPGMKEGETFIISPTWNEKYLTVDPRQK